MTKNNNKGELSVRDLQRILANPFYCIKIDPSTCVKHPALISEEKWIKAAINCIKEDKDGGKKFLTNLLENLKGNYI